MARPFLHRVVLVLLLAAVLAAPAIAAQPRARTENKPAAVIAAVVSALRVHVWTLLSSIWEKNGCGIDPHGGCTSSTTTTVQSDAGCGLDPHGGCGWQ